LWSIIPPSTIFFLFKSIDDKVSIYRSIHLSTMANGNVTAANNYKLPTNDSIPASSPQARQLLHQPRQQL
jgi:hypothetical protein